MGAQALFLIRIMMTWTRLSTEDACGHVVRLVPRACVCKRLKRVEFYFDGLEPVLELYILARAKKRN